VSVETTYPGRKNARCDSFCQLKGLSLTPEDAEGERERERENRRARPMAVDEEVRVRCSKLIFRSVPMQGNRGDSAMETITLSGRRRRKRMDEDERGDRESS
jgi:hypothetical protein